MFRFLSPITYHLSPRFAQAALSTIFLISGIMVFAGISIAFLSLSFLNASAGFQSSNRALALVTAGAQDALLQLERNKNFSDVVGYCVPLGCGTNSALVTVTQNSPVVGEATILSTATVLLYRVRLQAVLAIDAESGSLTIISWNTL